MKKQYFAIKLLASRPDFMQTMTDAEREVMGVHQAYWRNLMAQGIAVVFGPVLEAVPYGLGIVGVTDEAQLQEVVAGDPANAIMTIEFAPMMAVTRSES
jgi:hypothetical protein